MNNRTTAAGVDIPKFRYLDDITRFVDNLSKEVDELTKVGQKLRQSLAKVLARAQRMTAAIKTFNISDDDLDTKSINQLKRKIDPNMEFKQVPDIKELQRKYGLAEELNNKYKAAQAAEAALELQFPNREGTPEFETALQGVKALMKKIEAELRENFMFLHQVASGHMPKRFKNYVTAVEGAIRSHVNFDSAEVFVYVSVNDEGQLVYTAYIKIDEAVNDEGKITPHLYIALQLIQNQGVKAYVTHDFEMPNVLMKEPGSFVNTPEQAVKEIAHMLTLEDFTSTLGNLPMQHHMTRKPEDVLFSYKEHTAKIAVDNEHLIFILKPGTDQKTQREMAYQLYQEVKHMLKVPKGAKLKMELPKNQIIFNLASVANPSQINMYQAEWIKEQFGLSDAAMRKIVNIINQEQT